MMNLQNILTQIGNSTNPMTMMMNMLNPTQKQTVNQFKSRNMQQQAQEIADICNSKGISKEDLQKIVNSFMK